MKKYLRSFMLFCALCLTMILSVSVNAFAAERRLTRPGNAVKDGAYVYYSYNMNGIRQGIMRYNTVTKTKKQICDWKFKGNRTNGFSQLSVKGDYIYCVWDQNREGLDYIYRIKKDGSAMKKLAVGTNPVIVDSKIYYFQEVVKQSIFTVGTGKIYKMNLDGTGKTLVRQPYSNKVVTYELCRLGDHNIAYYDSYKKCYCDVNGKTIPFADIAMNGFIDSADTKFKAKNSVYRYYLDSSKRTLYRLNTKTNTKNKVLSLSGGYIANYTIADTYLTVKVIKSGSRYGQIYVVKNTGAGKVKLDEWLLGE